jgi:dTDP-4-dehydrorhamnose reductase
MRVLVIGGEGMLGHQLCRQFADRYEVWATFRSEPREWLEYCGVAPDHAIGEVEATASSSVEAAVTRCDPDVVVNAIGIVKQRDEAKKAVPSILINALFPHLLADICEDHGSRLIHVSTDCVFSGLRGNYREGDIPDPVDLYGRSKLLGEINRPRALTVRTSIIGWEVMARQSLLEWFADQRGRTIRGYGRAIYSGLSTLDFADMLSFVIEDAALLNGLYQVAAAPITKLELLGKLRDALDWSDITIQPDDSFACDRSLNAEFFMSETGWQPPSWDDMVARLAAEWPTYEAWRRQ